MDEIKYKKTLQNYGPRKTTLMVNLLKRMSKTSGKNLLSETRMEETKQKLIKK